MRCMASRILASSVVGAAVVRPGWAASGSPAARTAASRIITTRRESFIGRLLRKLRTILTVRRGPSQSARGRGLDLIRPLDSAILRFRKAPQEVPMTRNVLSLFAAALLLLVPLGSAQTPAANPRILLKTSLGDITIEIYPDKAPI